MSMYNTPEELPLLYFETSEGWGLFCPGTERVLQVTRVGIELYEGNICTEGHVHGEQVDILNARVNSLGNATRWLVAEATSSVTHTRTVH